MGYCKVAAFALLVTVMKKNWENIGILYSQLFLKIMRWEKVSEEKVAEFIFSISKCNYCCQKINECILIFRHSVVAHLKALYSCLQMDSQLACMMSESSVDYIARFNDLAQELAVTEPTVPQ